MFTALDLDVEEMKRLYAEGKSTTEIGEMLGCSYMTVRRRLVAEGVDVHKRGFAEQKSDEVIALYKQGISAMQIDQLFGWSNGVTSGFLRKIGLTRGKKGKYSVIPIKRICRDCGAEFETHNPDKFFCSKACGHRNRGTKKTDIRRIRSHRAYKANIPLRKLYERDGGVCYICGCKTDFDDYTVNSDGYRIMGNTYPTRDHVIPLAKGGAHSWDNVKLACFLCNARKGEKLLDGTEVMANA